MIGWSVCSSLVMLMLCHEAVINILSLYLITVNLFVLQSSLDTFQLSCLITAVILTSALSSAKMTVDTSGQENTFSLFVFMRLEHLKIHQHFHSGGFAAVRFVNSSSGVMNKHLAAVLFLLSVPAYNHLIYNFQL